MFLNSRIKKLFALTGSVVTISVVSLIASPSLRAQISDSSDQLLQQIAANTLGTLNAVNNIPQYLSPLTELANAWLNPDTTDNAKALQSIFPVITNDTIQNMSGQSGVQSQLLQDFLGSSATPTTVPYGNDLAYQTLLGFPLYAKDPRNDGSNPAYNYVKNASGLLLTHATPTNLSGSVSSIINYTNFYKTVNAIQTYNAYVLSYLYANYQNKSDLNQQQLSLYTQASGSSWFAQIASENIGAVLRQILMYNSQMYILMSQLLETQKQSVIAQTMTNTMLVILNQQNEDLMLKKAMGQIKG